MQGLHQRAVKSSITGLWVYLSGTMGLAVGASPVLPGLWVLVDADAVGPAWIGIQRKTKRSTSSSRYVLKFPHLGRGMARNIIRIAVR